MIASASVKLEPKVSNLQWEEDASYKYIINKRSIRAALYFEIKNPIYERNQHFKSISMVHDIKSCPIPFEVIFYFRCERQQLVGCYNECIKYLYKNSLVCSNFFDTNIRRHPASIHWCKINRADFSHVTVEGNLQTKDNKLYNL